MPDLLTRLLEGFTMTGDLSKDTPAFLRHHGRHSVADHVELVAQNVHRIAAQVGVDQDAALSAAWLHDVSLVLPYSEMIEAALQFGLAVLPEERQVPALLHGKFSSVFADKLFGVHDPVVLDAIRCHTTLKANATLLDKVLFVGDKLSWDPQHAPYLSKLEGALAHSIDHSVWCFLAWAWEQRHPVIHPWFRQAYEEFARDNLI